MLTIAIPDLDIFAVPNMVLIYLPDGTNICWFER